MRTALTLVTGLSLLAVPAAAQEKPKIAVVDLVDKGAGKTLAQNLTDVVTVALNKLQVFDVLSRADIQQMLAFEQDKQMLGCESDTSCLAELGGALGVALLVTGSIGKVGSNYIVNLTLTDTKNVKVKSREQRQVEGETALTKEVEGAARFLVRDLLAGQQGFLVVRASEGGADVEIDGRIVGVTPLARQTLSGGPHTLKLIKKGFVTWAKDVEIEKDTPLVVEASMVPSLEFIEEYDSSADTWRLWAYISGGLGVAAGAFGVIGYFVVGASNEKQFNEDIQAQGCQAGGTPVANANCAEFTDRESSIQTFDTISIIAGWVGVALIGTGLYLFFSGPEPGLYDQYKPEASVQASFDIGPTPGGGAYAGTTIRF